MDGFDRARAWVDVSSFQRSLRLPFDTAVGVTRAGFVDPLLTAYASKALLRYGPSPTAAFVAAARRHPRRRALVDDEGTLTYRELDGRTNAMANGLSGELGHRDVIGLLARNGRGFLDGLLTAGKLGAGVVLLNTGSAGPQLVDVCAREGITAVLAEESFDRAVAGLPPECRRWTTEALTELTRRYSHRPPARPRSSSEVVLLTSGTTGTPKGAHRQKAPRDPRGLAAFVAGIPYRGGDVAAIPAPLFHAWGFAQLTLALARGSTVVTRAHFEPEVLLRDVEAHKVTFLAVVPVMLQRILDLPADVIDRHDTSSLRVVASSGSALPGRLATRWMTTFGDNLWNLYGSTEVGHATVASPADLHAAPGTAGRPLPGVRVKVLDEDGRPLPAGRAGRIFVGGPFHFDGYTGGGSKPTVGRLMSTGDQGWFDRRGRLFVGGRDDDMIVSGGENVFPREVEDLLADHPGIVDVAVVGVPDDEFGQRLAVYAVRRPEVSLSEDDVRSFVRDHLARHQVPRDVHFVATLPRNATGKILRRDLEAEPRENQR